MNVNPFSYLIEKLKGKVDKSGDTMSGKLTIEQNTDTPLSVKRTNMASAVYMEFSNYNGVIGYLGVSSNKKPIFHDTTDKQIALISDIEYHIFRSGSPLSSYSCSISLDSGNRAFIILTRYGIWWGSVIDSGNNVLTQPLYTTTDAVRTINSASYSSGTLTIGFNGAMYGGITIIR